MKFALLIYENEQRFASGYADGEMQAYQEFGQRNGSSIRGGEALKPTSTARTVRVRNGETLSSDGPFAETKEQLGGFYLVEAASLDEAAAIAAQIPGARFGSIEVRPVETFS